MLSIQVLKPRQSWSPRPCVRYQNVNSQALEHIYIKLISKLVEALCTYVHDYCVYLYISSTCINAQGLLRDGLVEDDGIVLKGNRIVMPASLQPETLVKLHESHQGIEKMRLRARSCEFWNGINHVIEVVVRKCATCQEVQRAQTRVSPSCHTAHPHVFGR